MLHNLDKMKKQNKKYIKRILMFLGLISFFIVFFLLVFYLCNPLKSFYRPFFKVIPYPIAYVEGKIITTRDLLSNVESLKKFYNNQDFSYLGLRVDFKTEEGQQRLKLKEKEVFEKLIENELIKKIAESKGIYISEKEAGNELVTKAQEAGNTENLAMNLKKLYDWSLIDFRDKVILPRLYLGKLVEYYEEETSKNENFGENIKKAYDDLKNNISFEEVAQKYSEGETAENGGELGWFKREYLSDMIAEKAYSMQPGEFSEIISTSLGSHIIYLEDTQEKDGEKQVKLKQVFTREGSFLKWLNDEKRGYLVKIFVKDYIWDTNDLKIKFSNQEQEKEEVIIRNKSKGDPSIY